MKYIDLNIPTAPQRVPAMIVTVILLSFISLLPVASKAQTISPCDAYITYTINAQNPLEVTFCNASEYALGAYGFNFQWDLGDGFTSYDSCVTHVYSVPGEYTICFWVSACDPNIGGVSCGDDTCITINVGGKATSVIGAETSEGMLSVFPNPFGEGVDITTSTGDLIVTAEVFNLTGNRIIMLHTSGNHMLHLDKEIFPCSGHYILRISTMKGKVLTTLLNKLPSDGEINNKERKANS